MNIAASLDSPNSSWNITRKTTHCHRLVLRKFLQEKGAKVYRGCHKYVPNESHGSRGFHNIFKRTYHNSSASLAECPAGLMMFLLPYVTTIRPSFIINPVGTRKALFSMSFWKYYGNPFPEKTERYFGKYSSTLIHALFRIKPVSLNVKEICLKSIV